MEWYVYVVRHPRILKPIYIGRALGGRKREHIVGRTDNSCLEVMRQSLLPVVLSGSILGRFGSEQEAAAVETALIKRYGCSEDGALYNFAEPDNRNGLMIEKLRAAQK